MSARTPHASRAVASSLIVLGFVAAIAGGAVAATVLVPDRPQADLRPAAELTTAPTEAVQFADERTVPLVLNVTDPTPLLSNAAGTVTALRAAASQALGSGSSPLDVNGTPVLALHTTVPPYRDLSVGRQGADVAALQTELHRLGYDIEATGYYGTATSAAVSDLKKKAGAVLPDGALPIAQVLWLPAETVTPSAWTAVLGANIATGTAIGQIPGQLTGINVTLPTTLAPGPRSVRMWGHEASIDDSGRAADPEFLAAVMATPDYATALKSEDPGNLTVTIALSKPVDALKVPPTALFDITANTACLQTGSGALPVTVIGFALGASLVTLDTTEDPPPSTVALGSAITQTECR